MGYNIGPKIGIDGEREFRQQLKNINDTYKALQAETKAVTKAFDAQGDEQGKLEALSKQLNKQIEEQQKKQALLEDAVKKATAQFGEGSVEATRLRGALFDTKATIADLERELKDTDTQLENAGESMDDLKENTEDAGKAAVDFGDILGANLISDMIMDGLREMGSLVKDFAVGSIDAAADVKASSAQFEQTFGDMQESAENALGQISDDVNIAATRMQGSYTKIYAFAKTAGADSATALTIASRSMVAAADSAAYYDRSIEDTTETLQAFLKGNFANDAALGISCTETQRNAKANELYAKSFKELSEAQKVDTLLAMVEAGNKASGAIGQAARESDSWENVLGECSEMLRQVQANAGKSALQKLTPIIQKITKAGYELIEDIDWDKFGDTVADIIDGVIDHGPAVIRAVASIAAGIAAWKIAETTVKIASFAKNLFTVSEAATVAGSSVSAAGSAASAGPWGLAVIAIGAAVTALAALTKKAEEVPTEVEKATDRLVDAFDDAEQTYKDTTIEIEGTAAAAEYYIDKLEKLEEAGLDSAVAQREYEMVVEELNELVPELNLSIDEQTGLLNKNTDAIREELDAWKANATQKALQDRFTEELEAQGEANAELITAKAELNSLLEKQAELEEKVAYWSELSKEKLEEANALGKDWMSLRYLYNLDLSSVNSDIKKQKEGIAELEKELASYDETLLLAEESLRIFNEQQENTVVTSHELSDDLADDQAAIRERVEDLIAVYAEAKDAAMESVESQIGYFDQLSDETSMTVAEILENWEKQNRAFSQYTENLERASRMGLDQTLLQQLSDGSQESMLILNELVNNTETSIEEINTAFQRNLKCRDLLAGEMAAMQTNSKNIFLEIVEDAKEAGLQIAEGAAEGVSTNSWRFVYELEKMAKTSQSWWDELWGIHSPSRWMRDSSKHIVTGGVNSIDENADRFTESLERLALSGQDAFLQNMPGITFDIPSMVSVPAVNNSRSITHMGGFSIQIYQQPGESAENLAYRVMDIIQDEVASKGAVFSA